AMEDSSGVDLSHFRAWYSQAGTPRVKASIAHEGGKARIRLEQSTPPTPGQPVKQPLPIPLRLALFGAESGTKHADRLVLLDQPDAIHEVRERLRERLSRELEPQWRSAYAATAANRFELSPAAKGARRLKTVALGFLMASGASDAPALALRQFESADNMTDR